MEDVEVIKRFLSSRNIGSGYGSGSGSGYGDGDGDGSGSGYGDGDGDGSGSGDGLKEYNHEKIWYIDDVPTLIDRVHGDYARGRIVQSDLITKQCYVARAGNCFAHGDTLRAAMSDAQAKMMEPMPLEEKLAQFKQEYPSLSTTAKCADFYSWHHTLTGSCTMGRDQFVKEHGLDMNKEYTVEYFLSITKDSYGRNAIRQLRELYD